MRKKISGDTEMNPWENEDKFFGSLPDTDFTGALKDIYAITSSDIDGLTGQRRALISEAENLDYRNDTAGTLGSMLIPFLGGLAFEGGGKKGLGLGLLAAGAAGQSYYNNLEKDEKIKRSLLDREVDFLDKQYANRMGMQNQLFGSGLTHASDFAKGSIVGSDPWQQQQSADIAKFQAQSDYSFGKNRDLAYLKGEIPFLNEVPEQGLVTPGGAPTEAPADGLVNPAWEARRTRTNPTLNPGAADMVREVAKIHGKTIEGPVDYKTAGVVTDASNELRGRMEGQRRMAQFQNQAASTQMLQFPTIPGMQAMPLAAKEVEKIDGAQRTIASLERYKKLLASNAPSSVLEQQGKAIAENAITFAAVRSFADTGQRLEAREPQLILGMMPATFGGMADFSDWMKGRILNKNSPEFIDYMKDALQADIANLVAVKNRYDPFRPEVYNREVKALLNSRGALWGQDFLANQEKLYSPAVGTGLPGYTIQPGRPQTQGDVIQNLQATLAELKAKRERTMGIK